MVKPGIQVLRDAGWAPLLNRSVCALVHAASALPDTLVHTVDALHGSGVNLTAVLAPEHGFRGDRQAEHGDPASYIDNSTGLAVYSVYRRNQTSMRALLEQLACNSILVDIQDVGVRLYTFVWTMYDVMQAAGALPAPPVVVIADRPNPLGGDIVAGPLLNLSLASRYGRLPVTHLHGLTIGELARYFVGTLGAAASPLEVVSMRGWRRAMPFSATFLPWLPPSPNLPTYDTAVAYGATVFVEATTVSEGRGISTPFQSIVAPWINASALRARLGGASVGAARWRETFAIPTWWKFNGSVCAGVQLVRPDADAAFADGVRLLVALRNVSPPGRFQWDGSWFGWEGATLFDRYAGTDQLRELIDGGATPEAVVASFARDEETWRRARARYLIYS